MTHNINDDHSNIDLIERPLSVVTGKHNLEELYVLKHFPVFLGCVESELEDDIFADMHWCIDPDTGVIQLSKLIPLNILYQEQHADGCGPTWELFYNDFAEYVSQYNPISVLEIGGGQGKIAELVTSNLKDTYWTIIEPNPTLRASKRIRVVPSFFDDKFEYDQPVDTVVFSHVLEHIYDPKAFLGAISHLLPEGGQLMFAYPNLELWLKRKYTNSINFEHTMLLTDHFVEYLLGINGFIIKNKTIYKDHSFFYVAVKKKSITSIQLPPSKYGEYKEIFKAFVDYHVNTVVELNSRILNSDSPIYLFGGHIFSQYLLNFGLHQERIESILDNSKTKLGKRLYGSKFYVESPEVLRNRKKVNIILKSGIYNEEIKHDILNNINNEVVFWE